MSTHTKPNALDSESIDAAIGRRVHQVMWDRQVTQTTFAEMIHMDQSSIAKRLRGKLGWSAKHVAQAAEALNVSVAYLFGETDNGPHAHEAHESHPEPPAGLEPATCGLQDRPLAPVIPLFAA